jgi:hypothetical protein
MTHDVPRLTTGRVNVVVIGMATCAARFAARFRATFTSTLRSMCIGLALGLSSFGALADPDLPSFEQVRAQYRETNDLTRVSYLYRRCAALQLNVAALLAKKKQTKAANDYENVANHYMLMAEAVDQEVDKKLKLKSSKPMETVRLSVQFISEQYDKKMKDNMAKRGEFFAGDRVLEAELSECLVPATFAKKLGR